MTLTKTLPKATRRRDITTAPGKLYFIYGNEKQAIENGTPLPVTVILHAEDPRNPEETLYLRDLSNPETVSRLGELVRQPLGYAASAQEIADAYLQLANQTPVPLMGITSDSAKDTVRLGTNIHPAGNGKVDTSWVSMSTIFNSGEYDPSIEYAPPTALDVTVDITTYSDMTHPGYSHGDDKLIPGWFHWDIKNYDTLEWEIYIGDPDHNLRLVYGEVTVANSVIHPSIGIQYFDHALVGHQTPPFTVLGARYDTQSVMENGILAWYPITLAV